MVPRHIHADIVTGFGEDASDVLTVRMWVGEFSSVDERLMKMIQSVKFLQVPLPRNTLIRVHNIVMGDKRLTLHQIINAISISSERVENILLRQLSMIKVFAS